jgi:transcriptional regulator with XRE-family HTH domain
MHKRIKNARKILKLNQTEFARQVGLTQTALSMIEVGKSTLTKKNIKLICAIYNISERWLCTGEGETFIASPYEKEFRDIFSNLMPDTQQYLVLMARELLNTQRKIVDKKLNISAEHTMKHEILETRTLKAITGGDYVQIQKKYGHPHSYKPVAKLVASLNKLPQVRNETYAFVRRLVIIPFDVKFVENPTAKGEAKMDLIAIEKFTDELDGIFAWGIRGLSRLVKNGYTFTKSVKAEKMLAQYNQQINPHLFFVRKYVKSADGNNGPEGRVHPDVMYYAFKIYCTKGAMRSIEYAPRSESMMDKRLVLKGIRDALEAEKIPFSYRKNGGTRIFYGVTLRPSVIQYLKNRPDTRGILKGLLSLPGEEPAEVDEDPFRNLEK